MRIRYDKQTDRRTQQTLRPLKAEPESLFGMVIRI